MAIDGSSRRFQSERGQTTVEWIGTLAIVVALLGVVLLVVPTLSPTIRRGTICLVEKALHMQSSCTASSTKPSNEVVCATSTQTNIADDQLSVLFVNVGNNHTLIKTTYSNGEVQYTLVDTGEAELQADLVKAEGEIGNVGFNVQVSAAAGGLLQGSHTWTFANQAAADKFDSQVSSSGGWGAVLHDAAGPVGGWILNQVGIHGAPDPDSLDPGNLTFSYVAAGGVGQLDGGANFGLGDADAQLDAELKASLGARLITSDQQTDAGSQGNVQKGDVQFFINLSGNANAALQAALFGPSATGSGSGSGTAIVTVGPNGSLQQLQLQASGQYTGAAGLHGKSEKGDDDDEGEIGKALNLNVNDGSGQGYQYSGTLNLAKDPAASSALLQALSGNGTGISNLMQQINTQGTERVQPYTVSKSQSQAGLELEIADIGGGAQAGTSSQTQGYSPGWIKVPGAGWQQVVCEK